MLRFMRKPELATRSSPPADTADKLTPHILGVMAVTTLGTFVTLAGSYSLLIRVAA